MTEDIAGDYELSDIFMEEYATGIRVKNHYGIRLPHQPPHLPWPGFTGVSKVDGLIFGFGDPDSGNAILFKKKIGHNMRAEVR